MTKIHPQSDWSQIKRLKNIEIQRKSVKRHFSFLKKFQACGFHGDDKNAPMGLFVKVVYIRKDNTKAERTIWERIDAEGEPGIWTTTDPINIMDARYFEDDDMIGYSARVGASRKKKQQVKL